MADDLQKLKIQGSLDFIKRNLSESFFPPTLERVFADYPHNEALRREIAEMLSGDSIEKLYAAILLWKVDRPQAGKVLEELKNDAAPLRLPRTGGMGLIESSVKAAALDFPVGESVLGDNWSQAEKLSNLADSVSKQAMTEGKTLEEGPLPKWIDVLDARGNSEKEQALLSEIEKLKTGTASEKIYAALLLKGLDNPEYKEILESLLEDETIVVYRSGDLEIPSPAKMVAGFFLDLKLPGAPPKNMIAGIFDRISEIFDKGNKENK